MHTHRANSGGIKGRTERDRAIHNDAPHREDEPTQTDVAMELFEVVACDEQDLFTSGVVESLRRGLCESRSGRVGRQPGSCARRVV